MLSLASALLTSCSLEKIQPVQQPVALPSVDTIETDTFQSVPATDPQQPTSQITPTNTPENGDWMEIRPGIAFRRQRIVLVDNHIASISVVRIDPDQARFRVGYAPDQPPPLSTWCADKHVQVAINGGFFEQNYRSTALVISSGTPSGNSYDGMGGMFAVDTSGSVSLRYLGDHPYDSNEQLQEALQSWPMLIKPGGILTYTSTDNSERARRSVIARDSQGHILLIACSSSTFTLHGLADWLLKSDLDIDAALNLDGGSSTGLCVKGTTQSEYIAAFTPLPIMILVVSQE